MIYPAWLQAHTALQMIQFCMQYMLYSRMFFIHTSCTNWPSRPHLTQALAVGPSRRALRAAAAVSESTNDGFSSSRSHGLVRSYRPKACKTDSALCNGRCTALCSIQPASLAACASIMHFVVSTPSHMSAAARLNRWVLWVTWGRKGKLAVNAPYPRLLLATCFAKRKFGCLIDCLLWRLSSVSKF